MTNNKNMAVCCFGEVGRNFVDMIECFSNMQYEIFDDCREGYFGNKKINNFSSITKDFYLYVICSSKDSLQKKIFDKLKSVGVPDESIKIYNNTYYMKIWMKGIIVEKIRAFFGKKILIEILKDDDVILNRFTKKLVDILDNAPKYERDSAFYDLVYTDSNEYKLPYQKSSYFLIWKNIIEYIHKKYSRIQEISIIDIGCGNGIFAEMLFDFGVINYKGIDFSRTAIEQAKMKFSQKHVNFTFEMQDIFKIDFKRERYSCAIILEVLEHIEKDVELIGNLPEGMRIIASVPNFHSEGHIRIFKQSSDVIARYAQYVDIEELLEFNLESGGIIYLMIGTVL